MKSGHLGDSVGWAPDFSSGHDLMVCGFEPRIRLCADCFLRAWSLLQILCLLLSLSLPYSCFVSLCFSKINKCKKKKWNLAICIREIQIKTTLRYYLTPVRMAKINNSGNNRYWQGCGERGSLLHCWWECKLVQLLWKTVWRFLKELEIKLPYNPAIALLGIYPRDTGVLFWRDICTPTFIAAPSTIAKVKYGKRPNVHRWMNG